MFNPRDAETHASIGTLLADAVKTETAKGDDADWRVIRELAAAGAQRMVNVLYLDFYGSMSLAEEAAMMQAFDKSLLDIFSAGRDEKNRRNNA